MCACALAKHFSFATMNMRQKKSELEKVGRLLYKQKMGQKNGYNETNKMEINAVMKSKAQKEGKMEKRGYKIQNK